jgi:hypothetical protein
MPSPESPIPPRSPGFYLFRSHSSIPPPSPTLNASILYEVLPHFARQVFRNVTSIVLPIILLPLHFFFLFLSITTTLIAATFLSYRALMVYMDIALSTMGQIYADYVNGRKGRRRRDLLRKVVLEREEAVRLENLRPARNRTRGLTIA